MAAYAALVSLLNNIRAITNHPTLSSSLDNKHIQPLLEKTGFLLDFIERNNHGVGSKEAEDLERRIADAAHAAEDVIESEIVDQIHEASLRRSCLPKFLLKCVGFHISDISEKSHDLQQINEEMDAIMKEANVFKERYRLGEEQQPTHLAEPLMQSGECAMVGLDAELNQLLDELTGHQSSRRIISIVGMGGTGKTTLAKNVYENLLIKEKFQFRAWATISQQNNAKEVLSKLLFGLGESKNGTLDELGLQLHKTLSGRRYLIVLDDIWSVEAWDEVKRFFPDRKNGSRIILTTRLSNVAKDCGSYLFMINLLNEENSWKLFHEKTFQNEDCPPELREVGGKIVKLCKGLALSIVVIGGLLLKSPRTVGYWMKVVSDLKSITRLKEKQESLDVLSLSYNHLPSHLKPCFLYMGVFKEDSEIRVSKITKLWVAEGFIKPIDSRVLEETAEGFIRDLIDRNLILASRLHKNGKVASFAIHDLLRDLCIKLGEQEQFFHVSREGTRGIERRLVDSRHKEKMGVKLPLARSIMTHRSIQDPSEYRLLRVLHQRGFDLQANYYRNVNLRYLAYNLHHEFTSLLELRSSLSLPRDLFILWNLQTLIIKSGSYRVVVAPIGFWKMWQLRHVDCDVIYIPNPPRRNKQDRLLMLENLMTLDKILNFRLSKKVSRIIPNIKKLNLVYDSKFQGYDDSLIECLCNLDNFHKLETFSVKIQTFLPKKLPLSFPSLLNKVALSGCKFHWDDLQVIGSLPQLEVLKLKVNAVTEGEHWSPVDGQFRRLKFLKIEYCNLVYWDVEESHFPVLEKLFLKRLSLQEIPLCVGDIPTLEFICVELCSLSASISAVKIKEDRLETVGSDDLQVQVTMKVVYMSSFYEKLETEGLTTDNIQLYYGV